MEFLLADGSWKNLEEVSSAEVEHGILVCRNAVGDIVRTFARSEVLAFGDELQLKNELDRRRGRRTEPPYLEGGGEDWLIVG